MSYISVLIILFMTDEYNSKIESFSRVFPFLSQYRVPLTMFVIGLVLLSLAISLLIKPRLESSSVVFEQEVTVSAKSTLKVDIEGAVINPGVYEILENERIDDLLRKAGGLSIKADLNWVSQNLNRAAKLVDGGKIYIPKIGEKAQNPAGNTVKSNSSGVKISINTATNRELESISGIGAVTAEKIISARPYNTIEELVSRKIISGSLFEKISGLLSVY